MSKKSFEKNFGGKIFLGTAYRQTDGCYARKNTKKNQKFVTTKKKNRFVQPNSIFLQQ